MARDVLHLEADEHIILEVRKHWIVFVGYAISLLFSSLMPFLIFVVVRVFYPSILDIGMKGNVNALFLFVYCLWLLFLWISFFINWTKYYLDVWYVTEKRIIAVDQRKIFDRGISNLRFDKIQDVTLDVRGFIPTLLNYGNVKVQTAGEDNYEFSMSTVKDPENVRKVIFNQHNEIGDKSRSIF
ncbi:MAG: hypothetical protein AB201_02895 [Parcubacteria bacterium C7867-006]|nr:MAG: hypothetical protein AB201_02895 [Parcubacteria bacterium C7867-006]